MPAEKAAGLAETLTQGTWTHDHPLGFKHVWALGLPVRGEMPAEFYQLMALFPQLTRSRTAAVQYIPSPYRRAPAEG
jgi:hypothetical protein